MTNWSTPDAELLIPMKDMGDRTAWLWARRRGITGTDSVTLAGHNGYETIPELWDAKTIDQPPVELTAGILRLGHEIEPALTSQFNEEAGHATRKVGMLRHKQLQYLQANPDRLTADGGVLEIKTAGARTVAGEEWLAGRIPPHAYIQGQHYLAVTGRSHLWFAVGIRNDFLDYDSVPERLWRDEWFIRHAIRDTLIAGPIPRDEDLIADIKKRADEFWTALSDGDPSAINLPPSTPPEVRWREGEAGSEVEAAFAPATIGDLDRRAELDRALREMTAEKKAIDARLKDQIADREFLTIDGTRVARWATQTVSRIDTKALRENEPEIAEKHTNTSVERRLTILRKDT